ncbi:helicase-related protein [Peribacillus frigoritolerans]|uniref:helicase-related protein n=1 Tax=Peribacillus castrilensis TaxID=2897690 RepID=UPI002DD0592B|nr:helicase-related protein [Peribacillus castrilensis]
MGNLELNIENRDLLIDTLKQEFIGPVKGSLENMTGLVVDYDNPVKIKRNENYFNTFYYNLESEQEIIHNGNTPLTQYSSAMIFPVEHAVEEGGPVSATEENEKAEHECSFISVEVEKELQAISNRKNVDEETETEASISMSDQQPSSFAFTFYAATLEQLKYLKINIDGGIYRPFKAEIHEEKNVKTHTWWSREQVGFSISDLPEEILNGQKNVFKRSLIHESLMLEIQLHIRSIKHPDNTGFFITLSLMNISQETSGIYKNILFQSHMSIEYSDGSSFDEYPTTLSPLQLVDEEELSNQLLYHDLKNYALGHGCSVNWISDCELKTTKIESTFMPEHEITNITPDIKDSEGNVLSISMLDLYSSGYEEIVPLLSKITTGYSEWIENNRTKVETLPTEGLQKTANRHLDGCSQALERMEKGLQILQDRQNPQILKAFQFSNLAMYLQQISGGSIRKAELINGDLNYEEPKTAPLYDLPSIEELRKTYGDSNKGNWRAFQIAFLLMSLPSLLKDDPDRQIADLIWFPTGGGKTEAYLAVAATSILYRRLLDKSDTSTDVIMRYTLRLLTTDQFQRSARLICSLDLIRQHNEDLFGKESISIGIWLGSSTTPNKNDAAKKQLKDWKETGYKKHEFFISHCPLCRSEIGKIKKAKSSDFQIKGYDYNPRKGFVISCPDSKCSFHKKLPIYLIDEQLYKERPTFLIGTVDKFAMLAWKPDAKSLFGLEENGERRFSPPTLIIQDELHLISGPLGSTVGLYETLIEELCTDHRNEKPVKPKIICATATVRGYKEQIQALYAKNFDNISLFPSPGLSNTDSYFSQVHLDDDGKPSRGRRYLGIPTSSLIGIQQLQVKTYTTVLQTANTLKDPDPYWTLLAFYNSIRELGGSLTLFQTDISNYVLQFKNKHHFGDTQKLRYLNNLKELTSRLANNEVTDALKELKINYDNPKTIDVCLASNIIEVGVDVDRLSLMSIVGQPKNTAQYIQVSGRVGRAWYERPGLVMTLYKLSMSRDKSHFEHFKEYHQSLYTHVEATSLTPFSEPSIDRSLYGVMIAWIRQLGNKDIAQSPKNITDFQPLLDNMYLKMKERIELIDHSEAGIAYFEEKFKKFKDHLLQVKAPLWSKSTKSYDYYLMASAGSYVEKEYVDTALPVLTSMRNVDASCTGTVVNDYDLYIGGETNV